MLITLFILITKQQEITVFHDNPLQNQILVMFKNVYSCYLDCEQIRKDL